MTGAIGVIGAGGGWVDGIWVDGIWVDRLSAAGLCAGAAGGGALEPAASMDDTQPGSAEPPQGSSLDEGGT